jgi:hypothetical protein
MDLTHDELVQERYARWLDACTRVAFAVSLLSFVAYASGLLPAFVALEALPELWGEPVERYLERTGAPSGWAWLALLGYSDYVSLACIGLVGLVTLACYLGIVPLLLRLRERLQLAFAVVQIAVLLVAIAGPLAGGG